MAGSLDAAARGGHAGEPKPTLSDASAELIKSHAEAVTRKRERTAVAIENVEKQLRTSRSKQKEAAAVGYGSRGRPSTESPGRPLGRVVDEEPEPIHHLRAQKNTYLPES